MAFRDLLFPLFLDIDETIVRTIKAERRKDAGELPGTPDLVFEMAGTWHHVFLRTDLNLLQDVPFSLYTTGCQAYAELIAGLLREKGHRVEGVYSGDTEGRLIYGGTCFLIDDNPNPASNGLQEKHGKLPNATHLCIQAFRSRKDFATRRQWLEIDTREGLSLEDCLKRADVMS
jgi:hypothetical protein